ncbi:hypothetical protein BKA70DRAFT_1435371 [Coprinopsis sp. MPI-PUGE-AT-0042]|nr:hypothetical protein BKA70DRAFT_1435371 [Coprinopsis sp. MPI-PUGE-AT-0042]
MLVVKRSPASPSRLRTRILDAANSGDIYAIRQLLSLTASRGPDPDLETLNVALNHLRWEPIARDTLSTSRTHAIESRAAYSLGILYLTCDFITKNQPVSQKNVEDALLSQWESVAQWLQHIIEEVCPRVPKKEAETFFHHAVAVLVGLFAFGTVFLDKIKRVSLTAHVVIAILSYHPDNSSLQDPISYPDQLSGRSGLPTLRFCELIPQRINLCGGECIVALERRDSPSVSAFLVASLSRLRLFRGQYLDQTLPLSSVAQSFTSALFLWMCSYGAFSTSRMRALILQHRFLEECGDVMGVLIKDFYPTGEQWDVLAAVLVGTISACVEHGEPVDNILALCSGGGFFSLLCRCLVSPGSLARREKVLRGGSGLGRICGLPFRRPNLPTYGVTAESCYL